MGIDKTKTKLSAFALGATWAGMMGVVFAARTTFINPQASHYRVSNNSFHSCAGRHGLDPRRYRWRVHTYTSAGASPCLLGIQDAGLRGGADNHDGIQAAGHDQQDTT